MHAIQPANWLRVTRETVGRSAMAGWTARVGNMLIQRGSQLKNDTEIAISFPTPFGENPAVVASSNGLKVAGTFVRFGPGTTAWPQGSA
jgi:hypothetical protein